MSNDANRAVSTKERRPEKAKDLASALSKRIGKQVRVSSGIAIHPQTMQSRSAWMFKAKGERLPNVTVDLLEGFPGTAEDLAGLMLPAATMPCAACDGSGERADMPGHAGEPGKCYRCDGAGNERTKETA